MPEPSRSPFVLIVEDHPLVADSLIDCIHACDADLEVMTAESLHAALAILASRTAPLLIISDLSLTDSKGLETIRRLRQTAAQSPLLVFTALDDPALHSDAMKLGVMDYLVKSTSIQAMRDKIRALIGEQPAKSAGVARPDKLDGLLTQKQAAVLEQLAAGRSNKEIAARMNISDQTVASHMKEILGRLGVKNRTEAVVRYIELGSQAPRDRHKR